MRVRQEDTGEEIPLDGEPLGRGGEAAIYAVPQRPRVFAKVYHKPSGERAEKLAAMLAAPPDDPMAPTGHPSIAWPTARLLAPGVNLVVGYLMPRVEHGRLALEFYNPRIRQQLCPLFHYRYLVRTAHNLAASVRALHERGYVIGDLNESNVLVTNQALVALVDTDSFQVHTPNRLFRCRVGKPEYTPPELQNARFTDIDRLPEHDAFGLAVLIFQFLMQGTHPFAGMQVGEVEAGTIPCRIAKGYWPYTQRWEVPVRPSPHAPPWEVLPPSVQVLMRRCFEDGHPDPGARPPAVEWQRALLEAEQQLKICAANGQHHYHRGLAACPWCMMAQQQGRDPFPSLQEVRAKGKSTLKMEPAGPVTDLIAAAPPPPSPEAPPSAALAENQIRERMARIYEQVQTWPRSRLIGTGAIAAVIFLLLVILVPYVWSYLAGPRTPHVVVPPAEPTWRRETSITPLGTLFGHTAKVNAVCFLPDGIRVISGSTDNTLRLWHTNDHQEIRRFEGHQNWIMGLALSADGSTLISASADKTLRTWDVNSGNERHKLEGHASWINAVAMSADGRHAISGGDDRTVRLWDVQSGHLDFTFSGHSDYVTSVAITADGKFGLSGDAGHGLLLWDLDRHRFLRRLEGHTHAITGAAFLLGGRRAVSASRDRSVRIWDVERGAEVARIDVPGPDVTGLAVTADARRLLTVSSDGMLRLWDLVTLAELAHEQAPGGRLRCVALAPAENSRAMTGGEDGVVRLWRLPAVPIEPRSTAPVLDAVSKLELRGAPHQRVVFLPENRILMLESDRPLSVRELSSGAELRPSREPEDTVSVAAVSRNGRRLLTLGRGNSLRLRDLMTGTDMSRLPNAGSSLTALALNADGSRGFYPDRDHAIAVWNPERPAESRALKGHGAALTALAVTPDGSTLLSASADGTTRLWNVFDGRVLHRFVGFFSGSRAGALSADGRLAAILSTLPLPYVLIWDLENDRVVRYLPSIRETPVRQVYLADTGEYALTVDRENEARVWHVGSGTEIGRLAGNHDILAATFAGDILYTVDSNPTVRRFVIPAAIR